ncbi:WD40 repeat domain-containing protein [Myxococcota bacterium]|nr:WD40 repeat domain-containing protein [Myxococcota bacterium]
MQFRISLHPSIFVAGFALFLGSCGGSDSTKCTPENHCIVEDGIADCELGYKWADSSDAHNMICIPMTDDDLPDPTPTDVENTDALCSDGISNDGDRYIDCDDYDCLLNPDVTVCGPSYQVELSELWSELNPFEDASTTVVVSVDWHPTEARLLVAGNQMGTTVGDELPFSDGRFVIWDMGGEEIQSSGVQSYTQPISSVRWNRNGSIYALASYGTGTYWVNSVDENLQITQLIEENTCHDGDVLALRWSPASDLLYSVGGAAYTTGATADICSLNVALNQTNRETSGSLSAFRDVAVSANGNSLYVAAEDTLGNYRSGDLSLAHSISYFSDIYWEKIEVLLDGNIAAVSGDTVYIMSPWANPDQPEFNWYMGWIFDEKVTALAVHPKLDIIAVGTVTGTLAILEYKFTGVIGLSFINGHAGPIYTMDWSPDGNTLLSGGLSPALKSWAVSIGN